MTKYIRLGRRAALLLLASANATRVQVFQAGVRRQPGQPPPDDRPLRPAAR